MKHAALIMAHKNKEQLIRLIKAVSDDDIDVFVHLDKKWKLSKDEIAEIENCANKVFIVKKRIHGVLDGFSLPQIELNMIDCALKYEKTAGVKYNYFILLSGQDYPIKSKTYIRNFLEEQYPKPLVDNALAAEGDWVYNKFQLTKWENKITEVQKRHKKGVVRSIKVALYLLSCKIEKAVFGIPWQKLQKYGVKVYGGSQWWILPHGVIDYVNEQRKTNKKVIKQLKRAWTPEENFFQTLAMNSPYAKYVVVNDEIYDNEKGDTRAMTYCNFFTPTKGFMGHPHIITVEDFDRIMAKKPLFARKFDQAVDSKVLDMVDKKINE